MRRKIGKRALRLVALSVASLPLLLAMLLLPISRAASAENTAPAAVTPLTIVKEPSDPTSLYYNGVDAYEEYGKRIKTASDIAPLDDTVFGDQVSLYNGATTFEVTDVSLPGNNALPVALSRRLVIQDHRQTPTANGIGLHGFGDWDIDVPYISGSFTTYDGWTLYSATPGTDQRCSDNTDFPYTWVPMPGGGSGFAPYGQVWSGNNLHVPGQGDQILLANRETKSPAYPSAGTYKWVTKGGWKLECIASVSNLSGEGFVAVSPSGVKYTFNYATTAPIAPLVWKFNATLKPALVSRENIYLLATKVQDRFGNWVEYHYEQVPLAGTNYTYAELTGITSSDGRSITVNWSGNEISSVTSALGT